MKAKSQVREARGSEVGSTESREVRAKNRVREERGSKVESRESRGAKMKNQNWRERITFRKAHEK